MPIFTRFGFPLYLTVGAIINERVTIFVRRQQLLHSTSGDNRMSEHAGESTPVNGSQAGRTRWSYWGCCSLSVTVKTLWLTPPCAVRKRNGETMFVIHQNVGDHDLFLSS